MGLTADAVVGAAVAAVVAAPIAGVAVAHRRAGQAAGSSARLSFSIAWHLAVAALAFSIVAAAIGLASAARAPMPGPFVITYVTLYVSTLAFCAIGAFCGSCFSDPLDGAGCALAVSVAAAAGVLMLGPVAASAPTAVIDAALVLSPVGATTAAANIDLLRTDVLYRLSPLAHTRFDYPTWQTACITHGALAAACFIALTLNRMRGGRTLPAERINV